MSDSTRPCPVCRSEVPASATFCPWCAAVLPPAPGPVGGQQAHPSGMSGVVVATPGLKVLSWLVDVVATCAVWVLAVVVVGAFAGSANDIGGALAFLTALVWLPQLLVLVWGIVVWVWEGRTGNRVGNLVTRTRTVDASTGGPPGLGKVFLSRLVLGAINFGATLLGGILVSGTSADSGARTMVSVVALAVGVASVGTGVFDKGPLRQGWHEKASGTTAIRTGPAAPPAWAVQASSTSALDRMGGLPGSLPAAAPGIVPSPVAPPPSTAPVPDVAPPVVAAPAVLLPPVPVAEPTPSAVRPAVRVEMPPTVPVAVPPVAVVPPPALSVPDADRGLVVDVPGFERSAAMPAQAGAAAFAAPAPAPASVGGDHDIEHTRIGRRSAGRSTPRLAFDTGEVVYATGAGLVGRAPQAEPGESVEHLVSIDDPDRSVSKTHLSFGVDAVGLWVQDMGSTNGTDLVADGGAPVRLAPRTRVHVPDGATVRFGERAFTVGRA